MNITMKAGHLCELLETYTLKAGSERLFPVLPLTFKADGIYCSVASKEKTAVISAKWTPEPYSIEKGTDEEVNFSAEDLLPILSRFSQDDIITIALDKTMKFTGPGKEFTHYPASGITILKMPKEPQVDEKGVITFSSGRCSSFFTFEAGTFHDMLADAKVVDASTFPLSFSKEQCSVKLNGAEAKKDSAVTKLNGNFDGDDIELILGAELNYLMQNMKGDMTMQAGKGTPTAFIKKTAKPAGIVRVYIAPKVSA